MSLINIDNLEKLLDIWHHHKPYFLKIFNTDFNKKFTLLNNQMRH